MARDISWLRPILKIDGAVWYKKGDANGIAFFIILLILISNSFVDDNVWNPANDDKYQRGTEDSIVINILSDWTDNQDNCSHQD